MALSDEDVAKQLRHMVSFMEQEAAEKANEIAVKAEEDFNIEKGRLVQQEKRKIMDQYEKRQKQVDIQRRIVYSNDVNRNRLQVLEAQNASVLSILEDTRAKLGQVTANKKEYQSLLEKLILEGLYSLLEDSVVVICRSADQHLVESAIKVAQGQYQEKTHKRVTVAISNTTLPADGAGGVIIASKDERIKVNQTLEDRLETVMQALTPKVREMLFGKSQSRVYFD
jgi:V-type H+-transporting ATPase subunit E